ncbi:hypothetical protein COLO4_26440, partial [Corchorus olitorius]
GNVSELIIAMKYFLGFCGVLTEQSLFQKLEGVERARRPFRSSTSLLIGRQSDG